MKNKKFISILLMIGVIAVSAVYAGGGNRNGTAGASELLIPVGARGIAMAGANISNSSGIEGLYWNPAALARSEHNTSVMFSQMSYIADIGVSYAALGTNIAGFGSIGLSLKSLSMDQIEVTTVDSPDGNGQYFKPQFITLGLTYSKAISDRISVGATLNYVSEKIDQVSASGYAFNLGVIYKNLANINGLSFAMAIKNLGPQMKYDGTTLYHTAVASDLERTNNLYKIETAAFELPSTLELGLGYEYQINAQNSILVSGVFQNSNFYGDEYRAGLEYSFNKTFYLRAGYSGMEQMPEDSQIMGLTAGAGINYDLGGSSFKFDYAFRDVKFFSGNHVFTLQFGF